MNRLLIAILLATATCSAQNGYIHDNGDPRTLTPTPNCGSSRFYIDDSSGKMYVAAQGSPCVWQPADTEGLGLRQINALFDFWDSYGYGTGATQPSFTGQFGLLANSTPARSYSYANSGDSATQIANRAFGFFAPDPVSPSVSLLGMGENDPALNQTDFKNIISATAAWLTIPYQNRIMASAATASGGWGNDTTLPIYVNPNFVSPGGALAATSNAQTISFTIPSSNTGTKIGLTYEVTAAGTGTFTVGYTPSGGSLTLQTDNCSGTTTFTAAACGGAVFSTTTFVRQEFTIPAGAGTLTVTTTNTAKVSIVAADTIPSTTATNQNAVFYMSIIPIFTNYAASNATSAATVNTLLTDGLKVYYVNVNHSIGTARALNTTSDVSTTATASCPASTLTGHLNDCGHLASYNLIQAAEARSGYVFSTPGLSSKTGQSLKPWVVNATGQTHGDYFSDISNNDPTGNPSIPQGIDLYRGGGTAGIATIQDQSSGKPWSGHFTISMFTPAGLFWNCFGANFAGIATTANSSSSYTNKACFDPNGHLALESVDPSSSQTTVNCSGSGTVVFSQPLQGTSDKKVVAQVNACTGTASYTFPTAFSFAPTAYGALSATATSISTSAVTVTGSASTGSLMLESY